MSTPDERIGEGKGITLTNKLNRYPDNVGHASSGGQHYMLISAYKMVEPKMTTAAGGMTVKPHPDQKMVSRPIDWSCALYIPPGSLKQTISGKYAGLEQGATTIRAAGATANLLGCLLYTSDAADE